MVLSSFFVSIVQNKRGILTLKKIKSNNYGKINLKLKILMDQKNISINGMSRYANVRYETVRKYYNNENFWYDGETLAKFCYVLECELK